MSGRKRRTPEASHFNAYYQFPKFLFDNEFNGLDNNARVLYMLLRNRFEVSLSSFKMGKGGWINERGEIFFVFSREEMMDMLKLSKPSVIKAINDLKAHDLIQEERRGQGKLNAIFLMDVVPEKASEKANNFTSKGKDILPQEVKEFSPNKIEFKEISKDVEASNSYSTLLMDGQGLSLIGHDNIHFIESHIKNNIKYDYYYELHKDKPDGVIEMLDSIVSSMTNVISSSCDISSLKVRKNVIKIDLVREVFLKLTDNHVFYAINQFNAQEHSITDKKAYMRACLYSSYVDGPLENGLRL